MKHFLHLSLILSLFLSFPAFADAAPQKKKKDNTWYTQGPDIHYLTMWGGAGYSGLVGNYSAASLGNGTRFAETFQQRFIGGGGGLLGVGYELHHNSFLFSVGPELRFFSSRNNIAYTADVIRDDYATITQHYLFDDYSETQAVGQVMVCLYLSLQKAVHR